MKPAWDILVVSRGFDCSSDASCQHWVCRVKKSKYFLKVSQLFCNLCRLAHEGRRFHWLFLVLVWVWKKNLISALVRATGLRIATCGILCLSCTGTYLDLRNDIRPSLEYNSSVAQSWLCSTWRYCPSKTCCSNNLRKSQSLTTTRAHQPSHDVLVGHMSSFPCGAPCDQSQSVWMPITSLKAS